MSLPAYMITGIPVHNCIATNKMSSFMGTSVTTAKYARKGFIPWKIGIVCVPCALAGSALGAKASLLVPDNILKTILMIIIPLTGIYVITRKGNLESLTAYSETAFFNRNAACLTAFFFSPFRISTSWASRSDRPLSIASASLAATDPETAAGSASFSGTP